MNLVDRVKGMLLSPKTEWPKIAAEPMTAQQIYIGWVLILAAIGPIAILIGWSGFGLGTSLRFALANYLMLLVVTAVLALIVDALAPKFGGTKDFVAALKLVAFAYTAAFVGGIFHLLGHYGSVLAFVALVYSWYTLYLGAPVLRKCAQDKSIVFTVIVAASGFVLAVLMGSLASGGGYAPRM